MAPKEAQQIFAALVTAVIIEYIESLENTSPFFYFLQKMCCIFLKIWMLYWEGLNFLFMNKGDCSALRGAEWSFVMNAAAVP